MKPTTFPYLLATAAATLLSVAPAAMAQDYPKRAITLVVPYAAGGGTDNVARGLAKGMSEKLGQAVVVDNRGGGGGAIGSKLVAKSDPDGYTLLFVSSSFVTHAAIETKPSYDVVKDYAPIAMIGRAPLILVTHKSVGAKTVPQLITASKKKAEGINFASSGPGTVLHLAGELFKQRTGSNMTHVAYKGSGPATADLLAGRTQIFFTTIPAMAQQVKTGAVDLLAVTGSERSPLFPDVPTIAESGVPKYDITTWWGVLAPANTPAPIVAKLNKVINELSASESMKARLASEGATSYSGTPAAFGSMLGTELALWREVAKASNLKGAH
ncbi:tripartite tricarboxylate transporter substrate binding protein [Massilia niastensis]|uniref:tripartite tricarboxylate transporter substrate binding protein n=1 Tax=Massilia niastensis TaxID=544911 RepID=UPI00036EC871|nr:tripartite tricarboxylate transporter substrate binding protein [Massilia niastensis]